MNFFLIKSKLLNKPLNLFLLLCSLFIFSFCKKDKKTNTLPEPTPEANLASVVLEFQPKVDTFNLVFNKNYVNAKGDTFSVTKFKYFISNIVLTKADNTTYTEVESFHLVQHTSNASASFILNNVPFATYKSISFRVGIDSIRNVSGVQSGDLDPANSSDMYWNWSSGYIFVKLEGSSPKSGATNKRFEYHIGGYGGVNRTQRDFSFNFGAETLVAGSTSKPILKFKTNVNEIFQKPNVIDLSKSFNILGPGANAKMIADNYADMISFDKLQNN